MICSNCGNQVEEGNVFCKACGMPVGNSTMPLKGSGASANTLPLRIGIIAASLIMALASLLPFLVFESGVDYLVGYDSFSLFMMGDQVGIGIVFIIFTGLIVLFVCLRQIIPALIFCHLSFWLYCIVLIFMYVVRAGAGELLDIKGFMDINDFTSMGIGFYLMSISILALLGLFIFCVYKGSDWKKQSQ